MISRSRLLLPVLLTVLVAPALTARQGGVNKSLFVAVLDESGRPVRQFTADDVAIREDGQDRAVVAVKPASQPISVAFLVDTAQGKRVTDHYGTVESYVRDLRTATSAFAHQLLTLSPDAQVSLMEFGQAAIPNTPFTKDDDVLDKAMDKMVGKPDAQSVLTEAIIRSSDELAKRPSPRRVIASFNLEPSEEQSMEQPKKILQSLRDSVAQLWAVSLQRGTLKNAKRDIVLESLTKNTGGTRQFIYDQAAIEGALKKAADGFLYQYEIHFNRPDGKRPTQVQIGTLAQGVTLHASGFAPE